MEVEIAGSITELDKTQWDGIAENQVMSSYGWLKTVEETVVEKTIPQIFFITDSKGIVGASACYISNSASVFGNLDHVIFGRYHKLAHKLKLSFLPALICSQLFTYGSHFLFRKDLAPEKRMSARNKLFGTIEETAKKKRLPIAFINATVEEAELDGLLQNSGYQKVLDMPLCYLDIHWNSFNDYRAHIKSISRNNWKSIRREMNKNKKDGVLIQQLENLDSYEDRLHELVNMNINAYNRLPFMFSKSLYKKLKENLGNDATIYVAVKEGCITGVSISISKDGMISVPITAVDHGMSGNDFTYFNITYYRPIMDAILSGKTRMNYGRGMYELKRRRGCKVKNIFFYYKPSNVKEKIMAKLLFPVRGMWMKKILPVNIRERLSNRSLTVD